ncbi:hypothetical protein K439DRAFT_1637139 [Ramaria rubella]|nr:hypothetical protein K439DRAFT_1637139 [Ramaria rubella]
MGVVSEAASPEMAYADSPEQDNDVDVVSTTYFSPGLVMNLDLCQVIVAHNAPLYSYDVKKLFELCVWAFLKYS